MLSIRFCLLTFVFLSIENVINVKSQYIPPQAKVEPLFPKGIRISIPDEDGISLVAFHVRFNEEFDGLEAGTIARDILRVKNGRWTYQDKITKLNIGDVVHYWVHVVYNGLGYNLLFQRHDVSEFYNEDGTRVQVDNDKNNDSNNDDLSCSSVSITEIFDVSDRKYKSTCKGQLIFSDDFNLFNESMWRKVEQFSMPPDNPFVIYRQKNIEVKNGKLHLIPTLTDSEYGDGFVRHQSLTLDKCTGEVGSKDCQRTAIGAFIIPPVLSGYVDTKKTFAFKYGKIEIRAKLPKGDWIYPVLSLKSLEIESPLYPELKVASSHGNENLQSDGGVDLSGKVLTGGKVLKNKNYNNAISRRFSTNFWFDDYHNYELQWTNSKIAIKVDNIEYGSVDSETYFDGPFYVAIGLAVGGLEEFPDISTGNKDNKKPWKNAGSKALFEFYNNSNHWAPTWKKTSKDLIIDHIKIWAI